MNVEIHETIVTTDGVEDVVQLYISDAEPDAESAKIVLRLTVSIPGFRSPLVAQLQRAALMEAQRHIQRLVQESEQAILWAKIPIDPEKRA
jgi:hypothetical protein